MYITFFASFNFRLDTQASQAKLAPVWQAGWFGRLSFAGR